MVQDPALDPGGTLHVQQVDGLVLLVAQGGARGAQGSSHARAGFGRREMSVPADELSAEDAAGAKWWITELQWEITDRCLQLFGGYGYMMEYPIARLYTDARVARIYAGTSEVMKVIIAKSLGL